MSGIVIRTGDARDLADIMAVMEASFPPCFGEAWSTAQTAGMLAMPAVRLLLAGSLDGAVGFAITRSVADEVELLMLAVHPVARRTGVGRMLLTRAIDEARDDGARTLFLEMRDGNDAVHLYCAMGLVPVGHRPNYYRGADGQRYDARTYAMNIC